jgi:hypothetical protein
MVERDAVVRADRFVSDVEVDGHGEWPMRHGKLRFTGIADIHGCTNHRSWRVPVVVQA